MRLTPPPANDNATATATATAAGSELFGLIHAGPRLRTIAALAAIGETA